MNKIMFAADSCIEFDEEEIKEKDLYISKFTMTEFFEKYFSDESREFIYDLSKECKTDFYERLERGEIFRTAGLSPFNAAEVIALAIHKSCDVIYFCVSSNLSGTFFHMEQVFDECQNLEIKPYILDTLNASIGINQLFLLAEKLRDAGKSFEEIVESLEKAKEKVDVYFFTNNLRGIMICRRVKGEYPTNTTNTEYAFCLKDGLMHFENKSLNSSHAINKLCKYVKDNIDEANDSPIILGVATRTTLATQIEIKLKEMFPNREIITKQVSIATASHVGFGVLGVSFFRK